MGDGGVSVTSSACIAVIRSLGLRSSAEIGRIAFQK
jgi:hypothetical protein